MSQNRAAVQGSYSSPYAGFLTFACGNLFSAYPLCWWGRSQEDRQMLLYMQTWLPLLTITLTAAIFFSVASFIMGHAKS